MEVHETWCVVHACRNPYHCLAVTHSPLGTVPPDHPEHLVARRGNRLMLNLVDSRNPADIPKEAIDAALISFTVASREGGRCLSTAGSGYPARRESGRGRGGIPQDIPAIQARSRDQGVYGGALERLCRKGATT